jgi:hypothetical protein
VRSLIPQNPPPLWPREKFTSPLHSEAVAARVGRALAISFTICFVTGLLSHYQYHPWSWLPIQAAPVWGYRLTQGLHMATGIVAIPLLLVKLWIVAHKLWEWPLAKGLLHGLERGSIAILVSTSLLQLGTGFINILGWYPWPWDFVRVHFWLSFVVIGSLALHIAIKLPAIQRGLSRPADKPTEDEPTTHAPGSITRRGLLVAAAAGAGVVGATTLGQSIPALEPIALLAARKPSTGPQGLPINRTAKQASVTEDLVGAGYRLTIDGPTPFVLTLQQLEDLDHQGKSLPIACVEGWSRGAHWRGPRLLDIVRQAGGNEDSRVRVVSLEPDGAYRDSWIFAPQLREALLATHINDERLNLDHGYPLRLIAPNRAGVLQTKWITSIEVDR